MTTDYEPEPDDLTRAELAELAHLPWSAVADTLDDWLHQCHGVASGRHNVGVFLDLLALRGFEVTAKPALPDISQLLPPPTD